jgi:6-pyruvoyltetrahydropterin/6-carboxytetrahydropterin synthase
MIRLTRRYKFSASHRLHTAPLSEADNRALYGKCNNPYGHGHDYILEVSARGPVDERTGRLLSVEALDRLVEEQVLQALDHRDLNRQVPELAGVVPTTENVVREIQARLNRHWRAAFPGPWPVLERIRVHETKRNIFEVTSRSL